jgi:DNA-binding MarR family transcriptional regulator
MRTMNEPAEKPAVEAWRRLRSISHPLRALMVFPLDENEPVSMRDLARRLGCDNSYMTALVDALEEKGLAARTQHPTDRRVKVIVLSEAGRELAQRAQLVGITPPAAFDALNLSEILTLRDLLRKLDLGSD